ncbi:hypothetical protein BCON_0297g00010 [Botryotinia convoluta]|uniref:Uncharacterized protein n=1 Tax=Botryotinia convoluta TaxID=54673 RepID=A0A4Z1HD35_9HELO|nr:hypothetical protein BCON_0297g00010 [Botryotinia convoluta]
MAVSIAQKGEMTRDEKSERVEDTNSKITFEVEQYFIAPLLLYQQNFVEYIRTFHKGNGEVNYLKYDS